jgi:hypothetical protein
VANQPRGFRDALVYERPEINNLPSTDTDNAGDQPVREKEIDVKKDETENSVASHCSSAGSIVDKVPEQFVCFSSLGRLPRMFRKLEDDNYDAFVWFLGKWQFHDNVGEDTAHEWYKHSESDVYVR